MAAETVRYGIVGTGMMGIEHIQNILAIDGAQVTAIADPHPPSRQKALEVVGDAGDVATFDDHVGLAEAGVCDAVVVASPNMTHVDVVLDLLESDLHLLVEKPLCTTVEDCRAVMAAAEGRAGVVAVGLEYRWMPSTAAFLDEIRNGTVGTLRMLSIREHRFPFLVKVGNWNRFSRNTGGTLVEKCCHFFDLMRLAIDAEPVRVVASGGQDVNHLDEVYEGERADILDNAFVIVDFENGVRASLDLCMFAEATQNSEELVAVGDRGKVDALLPRGTIRIGRRGEHRFGALEHREVSDPRIRYAGFHHGASYLEHLDFLDAIRHGRPPSVTLEDGLWSVAMGVAAHRSIDEGRVVRMDEVL